MVLGDKRCEMVRDFCEYFVSLVTEDNAVAEEIEARVVAGN